MGLKKKNLTGYMGGGVFKPNAPVSSSFRGGGATEVGTEKKVQSYKKYAKKMFGGGVPLASYGGQSPLGDSTGMQSNPPKKDRRHSFLRKVVPNRNYKDTSRMRMTKADDRGFAGGGSLTSGRKRTPKKVSKKKPVFTPTKADDRGLNTGGPTEIKPITSTKNVAKKIGKREKPKKYGRRLRVPGSGDGKGGKKTKDLTAPTRGSRKFKTAAAKKKARAPKRFQQQVTGGGAKFKSQRLKRGTGGGG